MEAGGYLLIRGGAFRIKRASQYSILLENGNTLTPEEAAQYRYAPPGSTIQRARRIGGNSHTRQASLI